MILHSKITKHCIALFLFLFIGPEIYGQTNSKCDSLLQAGDSLIYVQVNAASIVLEKALQLCQNNSPKHKADLYKRIAIVKRIKTKYDESFALNLKALKIYKNLKDKASIAEIYHNLGYLMRYTRNFDKSIKYFKYAINVRLKLNDSTQIGNSYRELGVIYRKLKKYKEAKSSYDKARSFYNSSSDPREIIRLQGNYAALLSIQKKYDEAIRINKNALYTIKNLGEVKSLATRYGNISYAYQKKKEYSQSELYIDSAIQISIQGDLLDSYSKYIKQKSRLLYKSKNYKKAYKLQRKHMKLEDSLDNKKHVLAIENQLFTFELEKQKLKDSIQQVNRESFLKSETKKERLEKILIAWSGLILIFLSLIAYLWQYFRKKLYKERAETEKLANQILQQEVNAKEKEARWLVEEKSIQIELKKSILSKIERIQEEKFDSGLSAIQRDLSDQLRHDKQSNLLSNDIENFNIDFEQKLSIYYPTLTKGERRMCSLVRSGLTVKEIASIRESSFSSVKSMRYRIRKKLGLNSGQELQQFLENIFLEN